MEHRMTRAARFAPAHAARPDGIHLQRLERAVSWTDFRTAVRYDPASRVLIAVPAISAKHAEHPLLGEAVTPHLRVGVAEVYRREYEHGAVYWSERTGAHEVHGEIAARWHALGGVGSLLGLPATDERRIDGPADGTGIGTGIGGYAHFEGGSIYWTARHGAAVVHGMVRDIWALLGWERSALGLPVADVRHDPETGVFSGCFENGTIAWSPAGGPEISITAPAASGDVLESDECDSLGRLHGDFAECA
jgi:LGFP repeat